MIDYRSTYRYNDYSFNIHVDPIDPTLHPHVAPRSCLDLCRLLSQVDADRDEVTFGRLGRTRDDSGSDDDESGKEANAEQVNTHQKDCMITRILYSFWGSIFS